VLEWPKELKSVKETGNFAASHDEITRMLAEHGSLELLVIDFVYYTTDIVSGKQVQFILLCFLAFWFLTINHAAMRTAIPAFVYSLSLLNVQLVEKKK
jgi:hypothetical protein